jgi:hypothetical protein
MAQNGRSQNIDVSNEQQLKSAPLIQSPRLLERAGQELQVKTACWEIRN